MAQNQNPIAVAPDGRKVQWNGKTWAPLVGAGTEAAQVAARPNATAQAQAAVRRPLDEIPNPEESVTLPIGTGAPGVTARGKRYSPAIQDAKESQRELATQTGAVAGGMAAAPLEALVEGSSALPWLARAGARAAGTAAGAGAGAEASGKSHRESLKDAGIFGATELGMHALFSGGDALYKLLADPKMSMQQGAQMLAETISKEKLSPGEFGKQVQDGFDAISQKAGQEKREFLEGVIRDNPDLTVSPRNLRQVLQSRVQALETMKARNPELFKEGEAQERTLRILKAELDSANGEEAGIRSGLRKGNLQTADTRRSQFWNYKQNLDPSMASRIVGELDKASTQDITEALARKDPKLAQQYLEKSARYHELQDLGRQSTLKSVFGDARVAPDNVVKVFVQAPEESLKAIQTMAKDNPEAIDRMRRQLFEQSIKTTGVNSLFKQQPSLMRAIYGPQSDAVGQFVNMVNKKTGADTLLQVVPGKTGAIFRILGGGGKGVTIRASEMAKIVKSSEMLRLFTDAAKMPANSGPSRLMRETLDRAIKALDIRPGEAVPSTRRPLWKGGEEPPAGAAPASGGGPPPPAPESGGAAADRRGGSERRGSEGASPTGAERRLESRRVPAGTPAGSAGPIKLPKTEGEELEASMRTAREGKKPTGRIEEGEAMMEIMRDPKEYARFKDLTARGESRAANDMLVAAKNKLLERQKVSQ